MVRFAGRLANATGTIAFHLRDGRTLPSGLIVFSETFEGQIALR